MNVHVDLLRDDYKSTVDESVSYCLPSASLAASGRRGCKTPPNATVAELSRPGGGIQKYEALRYASDTFASRHFCRSPAFFSPTTRHVALKWLRRQTEAKKKTKGTKASSRKFGIWAETPPSMRDGSRRVGRGRRFDTKVAKSQRSVSLPAALIEKCCWVTAPHAGVKIKARGSATSSWPSATSSPDTGERERSGEGRRRWWVPGSC